MNSLLRNISVLLTCLLLILQPLQAQEFMDRFVDESRTFDETVALAEAYFDDIGRQKHVGYKQYQIWKYFAQRNLDENGYVLTEKEQIRAYQQFVENNHTNTDRMPGTWVEKGPLSAINTSTWSSHIGRITNIGIDPNDDNHLLVTSPGGGVWNSTDEGNSWTPLFDQENSMNAYSAMISHADSDDYYIGLSSGMRRSTDGGLTWSSVSGVSNTIYTILQHPTDADIILASSSNGRVYRTTDGGTSWSNTLVESSTSFYDLEFNTSDPDIVYTSGTGGAIYKSLDNGISWSPMTGPWNSNRSIMIAVTPDDSDYIYVLQESGGGFGGLYLSTDGGTSFTTQADNSSGDNNMMGYNLSQGGGQAPRDMDIIASPTDKTEVHLAGIMTWKSTDSGVNWNQTTHWVISNPLPFVHADIDQLIYKGSKIYVASDGGVFISDDGGNSFQDKTTGLGTRQFYRLSASTTDVARVAGGSQDNGTGILKDELWYDFMGADGMEPLILNHDEDVVIGSIQFGQLNKSTNGGGSLTSISQTQGGASGEWVTPLERDPINRNTIYQGKRHLYKSDNAGGSWTTISDVTPSSGNTNMDEICIAPSDNNVIYISYSSDIYRTTDGGENWTDITPTLTNHNFINYINVHPTDPDRVILALSGSLDFIESTDGGATWSSIKYNLPNLGANSVVFDGTDNDGIYVSMTKGVYYKDDSSPTTWTLEDTGLPQVDVTELEIVNDKLYASTYGRGLWELTITGKGYELHAGLQMEDCFSQGTEDPSDDTFTFSLDPKGMGLGTTYSVSGDIVMNSIAYDTPQIFDNAGDGFLKSDGAIDITITDDDNASANISIKVNPNNYISCYNNLTCDGAFIIDASGVYSAPGPVGGSGASTGGYDANWYIYRPKANGTLSIHSCGSGEDTRLRVHTGTCEDLTQVAFDDDTCEMSPGSSLYASELEDIPIDASNVYYIEWDSRWSSDPFDFTIEIKDECLDELYADASSFDELDLKAHDLVKIKGTITGNVNSTSPGMTIIDPNTSLNNTALLNVLNETCDLNDYYDLMMLGGANLPITDNGIYDFTFDVPASVVETIGDLHLALDINHTELSELKIELISPANTTTTLWDFYCSGEEDLDFIIDDDALSIQLCGSDFRKGQFIKSDGNVPQTSFNVYDGEPFSGTWTIRIQDNASGNVGKINKVYLYLSE